MGQVDGRGGALGSVLVRLCTVLHWGGGGVISYNLSKLAGSGKMAEVACFLQGVRDRWGIPTGNFSIQCYLVNKFTIIRLPAAGSDFLDVLAPFGRSSSAGN